MSFYYPVYEDFDILHHMPVDSVETDVMLGDDDSDSKTLHIEIRQNGESFYSCDPVVDTTMRYYRCSDEVDVDLFKGDTLTFYLSGSGTPQGVIGGPNTLALCTVTEDEQLYLPIIVR